MLVFFFEKGCIVTALRYNGVDDPETLPMLHPTTRPSFPWDRNLSDAPPVVQDVPLHGLPQAWLECGLMKIVDDTMHVAPGISYKIPSQEERLEAFRALNVANRKLSAYLHTETLMSLPEDETRNLRNSERMLVNLAHLQLSTRAVKEQVLAESLGVFARFSYLLRSQFMLVMKHLDTLEFVDDNPDDPKLHQFGLGVPREGSSDIGRVLIELCRRPLRDPQ